MTDGNDWQKSPTMLAAALEGVSGNRSYPPTDRIDAAQQAIVLLRQHIKDLEARSVAALAILDEYDQPCAFPREACTHDRSLDSAGIRSVLTTPRCTS